MASQLYCWGGSKVGVSVLSRQTRCYQAGILRCLGYFYVKLRPCNCRCKIKWRVRIDFTSALSSPGCCASHVLFTVCSCLSWTSLKGHGSHYDGASRVETQHVFSRLLQTEYAINRACRCGCHFRMLPQQWQTSTKVTLLSVCVVKCIYWSASCST